MRIRAPSECSISGCEGGHARAWYGSSLESRPVSLADSRDRLQQHVNHGRLVEVDLQTQCRGGTVIERHDTTISCVCWEATPARVAHTDALLLAAA